MFVVKITTSAILITHVCIIAGSINVCVSLWFPTGFCGTAGKQWKWQLMVICDFFFVDESVKTLCFQELFFVHL